MVQRSLPSPSSADSLSPPSRPGASGLYDRARPDYPLEAIDRILASLPNQQQQGAHVVELGAGTGLFTRGFLARAATADNAGRVKRLTAVEPSEGMREGFEKKLEGLEGTGIELAVVDGLFDRIPAPDASADLVRSLAPSDLSSRAELTTLLLARS